MVRSLHKQVKVPLPKISVIKTERHVSTSRLLAFIIIFGALGAYAIYRSLAATPLVASLEAEQMTLPAGASVYSDASASGGKAVQLTQDGSLVGTLNIPTGASASSVTVMAHADKCRGNFPRFSLTIDSSTALSTTVVPGGGWTAYTASTNLVSGSHSFRLIGSGVTNFANCSRKLDVDVIDLYGIAPVTAPVPTLAFSASPLSITAGTSAMLTWSTTNASSCTASGTWSGAEPISGSQSTGALNNTASYNLSCSGSGGTTNQSVTVTVNTSSGDNNVSSPLSTNLGLKTLAFDDEFNGAAGSGPDSTKWGAKTQLAGAPGSNAYFNGPNNVHMDGKGNLDIHAILQSSGVWDSAELESKFGASPPYLYEARAKVSGVYGMWNAPAWDWSYPYGKTCGYEIDNSEQLAKQPTTTNFTMHGCTSSLTNSVKTPYTLADDFHIYSTAVYADHADFYLDGVKYATISASQVPSWQGSSGEHSFLTDLDAGTCGSWADCPSPSGPTTADMLIDWYHVYTR